MQPTVPSRIPALWIDDALALISPTKKHPTYVVAGSKPEQPGAFCNAWKVTILLKTEPSDRLPRLFGNLL